MNTVVMTGRLTKDVVKEEIQDKYLKLKFTLAVDRSWKNKAGEYVKESGFVDCVFFAQLDAPQAKWAAAQMPLEKGKLVHVVGKMCTESWEKDGEKVSRDECIVERMDSVSGAGWKLTQHQACYFAGHLAADAEFKRSDDGRTSARIRVGVNAGKDKTYWLSTTVFGKDADQFAVAKKGDKVVLFGAFSTSKVDGADGKTKHYLNFHATTCDTAPKDGGDTATPDSEVPANFVRKPKMGGAKEAGTAVPNGENEFNDHGNPPVGGGQDDLPF